jgi:hypothetical protein
VTGTVVPGAALMVIVLTQAVTWPARRACKPQLLAAHRGSDCRERHIQERGAFAEHRPVSQQNAVHNRVAEAVVVRLAWFMKNGRGSLFSTSEKAISTASGRMWFFQPVLLSTGLMHVMTFLFLLQSPLPPSFFDVLYQLYSLISTGMSATS